MLKLFGMQPLVGAFRYPMAANLRTAIVALSLVIPAAPGVAQQNADGATDARTAVPTPDPDIEALLRRMTVEEKVGQLSLFPTGFEILDPNPVNPIFRMTPPEQRFEDIRRGLVTGIFNGHGAEYMRQVQTIAVNESRLGIPLIFGADVIHGFRTVFPVPLAEAASWDPDLAYRTARVAAREATAAGINWNFAPMVDIGRDARWGRIVETAGEDVLLSERFAIARVRGFQGDDLARADTLVATPKHFAGYGAAEGGLDYNTAEISERSLREVHLPPFKAAFDAGALSTMSAFHDNSGIPASGDRYLLTDILRGEWGFEGFVVSDFNSDIELVAHGIAKDPRDAARIAFLAGVDMSMNSGIYNEFLPGLVREGLVPEQALDNSVRRILNVKKALGLFENPFRYIDAKREQTELRSAANLALAREAARKSIVMLRNEGRILPLDREDVTLALIGPFVDVGGNLNGPWSIFGKNDESVSVEAGLRAVLGPKSALIKARGSDFDKPIAGGLDSALAAAARADVIILQLGETEGQSGEAKSRSEITLPPAQIELVEAIQATGKPVVILLTTGRPLALPDPVMASDALLVTWFLGSQAGHAIGDILFGDHAPSGRLPVSFPTTAGQEPFYYSHRPTGRADTPARKDRFKTKYLDASRESAFPFGFGLTFGQIVYSPVTLPSTSVPWDGTVIASVTVTNTGPRAADETVQLYLRDNVASVSRPVRELKDFRQIRLEPGESKTVTFEIEREQLGFVGRDLKTVTEPGDFAVWIAPDAASGEAASFALFGGAGS